MTSAAEIKLWTGIDLSSLSDADLDAYIQDAENRLARDNASSLPEPERTKAICYLIASSVSATNPKSEYQSQTIGGYSYNKKSITELDIWIERYRALLPTRTVGRRANSNGVGRVDRTLLKLGGRMLP